jgi:hypothetical protein
MINLMIKIKNPILPSFKMIIKIFKESEKFANMIKKYSKMVKKNQISNDSAIKSTTKLKISTSNLINVSKN